ncbi:MAG: cysteine desulfurase, partial [Bacteroidales bacterium]|nr:cysteine desulfurase [Bacteroidales bacterium]
YGKPLVYLDNAATAQRPQAVTDCWVGLVNGANSNIHRAVHHLAAQATEAYEGARDRVRHFINAGAREEVIFTSGATASINLVASSFGQQFVNQGDEVIVSVCEHHSNIIPWQLLCERKGARLKVLETEENGRLSPQRLRPLLSSHTKIVAITHISNVLGVVNPVKELVSVCHEAGVPVLVDGAQGIVHGKVDVQDLDCDFYAFSGHKVYAATGTGVLYGKRKWLDAMPPYMGGGEMIETVRFSGTTYAPLPMKFEAGTQNFNAVPTLVPALDFAEAVREDKEVQAEQEAILDYVFSSLTKDSRIVLYGSARECKIPLFSFAVKGVHHEDLALILDKMGIAVRSGQMCAEPLMDHLGVTGLLRVSFALYNTLEEAKYFVASLGKAIEMLL